MELNIATLEDIVLELRRRAVRFVFVGVEPTNGKTATIRVGASGSSERQIKRLLMVADRELGLPSEGNDDNVGDGEL